VLALARDCLAAAQVEGIIIDLGHARIVRSQLAGVLADTAQLGRVHAALAAKDASELASLTRDFPAASRQGLQTLLRLYGDASVLAEARRSLPPSAELHGALDQLEWLARHLQDVHVSFDLADLRGYAYYSGARFAVYAPHANDALARGGRYDEVGAVFGRNRPAVGFSLDLRQIVTVVPPLPLRSAIRAPWSDDAELRAAIMALRCAGETVVRMLPGHDSEIDEFHCDRALVQRDGVWTVQVL
ncbi:MAG TPA: ATP phosphoribosyltransferase regulatory subunit, partial [Burkholderiaceae bacterium]